MKKNDDLIMVRMPSELRQIAESVAVAHGISLSELMRRAIVEQCRFESPMKKYLRAKLELESTKLKELGKRIAESEVRIERELGKLDALMGVNGDGNENHE